MRKHSVATCLELSETHPPGEGLPRVVASLRKLLPAESSQLDCHGLRTLLTVKPSRWLGLEGQKRLCSKSAPPIF